MPAAVTVPAGDSKLGGVLGAMLELYASTASTASTPKRQTPTNAAMDFAQRIITVDD
jgi:hypothetical protein